MAFPFPQGLEASEAQRYKGGGALRYKFEVHRQYFSAKLYGLGVPEQYPNNFLWPIVILSVSTTTGLETLAC